MSKPSGFSFLGYRKEQRYSEMQAKIAAESQRSAAEALLAQQTAEAAEALLAQQAEEQQVEEQEYDE